MFDYTKRQYVESPVRKLIWQRLVEYGKHGVPLGDFLTAVICNDWKEAIARADEHNLAGMHDIMIFMCNEMPMPCFGSPWKVIAWMDQHGNQHLVSRYIVDLTERYLAQAREVS